MRNSNSSSSSKQHSGVQQLLMIPDAFNVGGSYDFNRVRTSESTEPAKDGPSKTTTTTSSTTGTLFSSAASVASSACAGQDCDSRGVPISPVKMPPTPPRDSVSPYNPYHKNREQATVGPSPSPAVRQPFLSSPQDLGSGSGRSTLFLRPSTTQSRIGASDTFGLSTSPSSRRSQDIFRPSSRPSQQESVLTASREEEGFYSIHRCSAFDDESDGRMAEF
mmetsp:Transcript_539/g.1342  ORF Transcript_539/g.1342 Transcript_539/m.1342 type:complete len:220 (+) Transcript_539:231-890(+)